MKLKFSYLVLAIAIFSFAACNNGSKSSASFSGDVELNNELDSVSYSLGVDIAQNIERGGVDKINIQALATGLAHVMDDDSLSIKAQEGKGKIQAFFQKVHLQKLQKNKEEGEKFLEENKKKEGIVVLESGIQYKVVKKGDGPVPNDSSTVKVNYKGTLIDGTQFDSSYDRGKPFETKVNGRIIKGWTEILQIMPVGSKYLVYIPTELGYGEQVRPGGVIEANMALIFEMELLEIVQPEK